MWRVELHCHTSFSPCATLSPETLVRLAQKKGLDAIAITDHDRIDGAQYLSKIAPFKVVIGEEITSRDGDIIGYFLNQAVPPGLSAEETIAAIREQGGLVSIPHPCDIFRKHRFNPELLPSILPKIDFFEVWNSRNILVNSNREAERLAVDRGLRAVSGSDTHTRFEVDRGGMLMPPFNTPAEMLESVSQGRLVKVKSPVWVHGLTKLRKLFS